MQGHLQLQLLQVCQAKLMLDYCGISCIFLNGFGWQKKERGHADGNTGSCCQGMGTLICP
jgi:hypothetical protein